MYVGDHQNNESYPFSKLPLYLLDQIMAKMTFETYAKFMQTGKLAQEMNNRNHKLMFPLKNKKFDEIRMERTLEITTWETKRKWEAVCYFKEYDYVSLSLDMCKKIRFEPLAVTLYDDWPSKEACNFLMNLCEITYLDCQYPYSNEPHVLEFFKNAKIRNLVMSTDPNVPINHFSIDTSNIDRVQIMDCRRISPEALWSIKARKDLHVYVAEITADHLLNYIELLKSNNQVPNLFIFQEIMRIDQLDVFLDFLVQHGRQYVDRTFGLCRMDETQPFVIIDVMEHSINFRKI